MSQVAAKKPIKQLPSADGVAVGLGVVGLALSRFIGPFVGLVGWALLSISMVPDVNGIVLMADQMLNMLIFGVTGWALINTGTGEQE